MPAAAVNRIESRRQSNDCAVWALAVYLGISYEDVWQAVVMTDRSKGKNGLYPRTVCRIAELLGHPLKLKRRPDLTEDYGILFVSDHETGHAAVLRAGLVFDVDATVWDADEWLKAKRYVVAEGLLVAVE
jgi:hypothetical protein